MDGIAWRAELRRYAAPVLLLAVVTLAALAARGSLAGKSEQAAAKPRAHALPATDRESRARRRPGRHYVVQRSDTLGRIAERFHTSVERLLALNPGIEPTALRVGRSVRVR